MARPRHEPETASETLRAQNLKQQDVSFALLRVTQTGLAKRLLDANRGVQDHFRQTGFHNYNSQATGRGSLVHRPTTLVGDEEEANTRISLYRPSTKTGDARLWITDLALFARVGELLALAASSERLRVFNFSSRSRQMQGTAESAESPLRGAAQPVQLEGVIARQVYEVLAASGPPLLAQDLARHLSRSRAGITRRVVNGALYGELGPYVEKDDQYRWALKCTDDVSAGGDERSAGVESDDEISSIQEMIPAFARPAVSEAPGLQPGRLEEITQSKMNAVVDAFLSDGRTFAELSPLGQSLTDTSLDELDLETRTFHALRRAGLGTTTELAHYRLDALRQLPNVGIKTAQDAVAKLIGFAQLQPSSERPSVVPSLLTQSPRTSEPLDPASSRVGGQSLDDIALWAVVVGQPSMTVRDLASCPRDRIPAGGGAAAAAASLLDAQVRSLGGAPPPRGWR